MKCISKNVCKNVWPYIENETKIHCGNLIKAIFFTYFLETFPHILPFMAVNYKNQSSKIQKSLVQNLAAELYLKFPKSMF